MIRRKRYFVDKNTQMPYLGLVTVPLAVLLTAVYYAIYYAVMNQLVIPEAIASALLPAMKKVNSIMIFVLPVCFYLIVRAALIYSNKIVGPVPRIERELDRAIAGDYSVRLKTRDNDALAPMIGKVNVLLEKMERERDVG